MYPLNTDSEQYLAAEHYKVTKVCLESSEYFKKSVNWSSFFYFDLANVLLGTRVSVVLSQSVSRDCWALPAQCWVWGKGCTVFVRIITDIICISVLQL